jgi:hypothetical protein
MGMASAKLKTSVAGCPARADFSMIAALPGSDLQMIDCLHPNLVAKAAYHKSEQVANLHDG